MTTMYLEQLILTEENHLDIKKWLETNKIDIITGTNASDIILHISTDDWNYTVEMTYFTDGADVMVYNCETEETETIDLNPLWQSLTEEIHLGRKLTGLS